ncbi:MAG: hypothetical protein WC469_05930 [Candidatus Omnitrophota bacterium]
MQKKMSLKEEAICLGVLINATESLERLKLDANRLCGRLDTSLYFRPVNGRSTRGAFPILFCKPTKVLTKYLLATHALEIKHGRIKRTAAPKGFCRWIDILHGHVCEETNRFDGKGKGKR